MSRTVKELWWEERDLHIIYADDDTHVVFKNAWVSDMSCDSVEQDEIDPTLLHGSIKFNVY